MTKPDKILGLDRASGEGVVDFRERVVDVLTQYGYVQDAQFEEQGGAVLAQSYGGVDKQFLVCKFPVSATEDSKLSWDENSGPDERYDAFVSLKNVPSYIAEGLAQDLAKYEEDTPKEFSDILGVLKEPRETRSQFRQRLDTFFESCGFFGNEFHISDEGDLLYKFYERNRGEIIDVTYAGDNIADTHGFDSKVQKEFYPHGAGLEDIADAAIIFENVSEETRREIYEGLEEKFTL